MNYLPLKISTLTALGMLAFFSFFLFLFISNYSVLTGFIIAIAIFLLILALSAAFFTTGNIREVLVNKNSLILAAMVLIGGSSLIIFLGSVLFDWMDILQSMLVFLGLIMLAGLLGVFYGTSWITSRPQSHKSKPKAINYSSRNITKKTNFDSTPEPVPSSKFYDMKHRDIKFCENCGAELEKDSIFCNECGSQV